MKSFCIIALALIAYAAAETYDPTNDDLDIEAVVEDQEKLQAFSGCFIDKVDCSPVTADFKKDMTEAVQQACAKCTEAQKHLFKVFLHGLKDKLPAEYEAYRRKYDPENKYFPALLAAIDNA